MPRPNTEADFWALVDKTDGCWNYSGWSKNGFHGTFCIRQRRVQAHRFSWELANGPIPVGMDVLHRCDNGRCVRPDHLFLGTQTDNAKDMYTKRRNKPSSRATNGQTKIPPEAIPDVVCRWKAGERQRDIAASYQASDVAVSTLLRQVAKEYNIQHLLGRNARRNSRRGDLLR